MTTANQPRKPLLPHAEELARRTQVPVACQKCGTEVLVQKYSYHHTSIQWQADAEVACQEFQAIGDPDARRNQASSCQALRSSIEDAVIAGIVPVPDEDD